jgi:hypothetical protein
MRPPLLLAHRKRTRNGKIARLPETIRERISQMIQDGVRYRDIIKALAQPGCPPLPYPISEMNLSNWRKGGHQEWLRRRDQIELDRRFPLPGADKAASIRSLLQQLRALTMPGPPLGAHLDTASNQPEASQLSHDLGFGI